MAALAASLVQKASPERDALLAANRALVTPELVQSLIGLARKRAGEGDRPSALAACELAAKVADRIGDSRGAAQALKEHGNLHADHGSFAQALHFYDKALSAYQSLSDQAQVAIVLSNIGMVHADRSLFTQALKYYQDALALEEKLGDPVAVEHTRNNIGRLQLNMGSYGPALSCFQKNLTCFERVLASPESRLSEPELRSVRYGVARALNNIGNVYNCLGNHDEALTYFRKAQAHFEALGLKPELASALGNIGEAHRRKGELAPALDCYTTALEQFKALQHRPGMAITYNNLGLVHHKRKEYAQAVQAYQQALQIAEEIGIPDMAFYAYWGIGEIRKDEGSDDAAIAAYEKATGYHEAMRSHVGTEQDRLRFLHAEGKDDAYQSLVYLLCKQGKVSGALAVLERANSRQLLDGVRRHAVVEEDRHLRDLLSSTDRLEQGLRAQERERYAELEKPEAQRDPTKLKNLDDAIARQQEERDRFKLQIEQADQSDFNNFVPVRPEDLETIQESLPDDVVVAAYAPLEPALVIFLVTKQGIQHRTVPTPRRRIEELIDTFLAEMATGREQLNRGVRPRGTHRPGDRVTALREALTALYQYLIVPIKADLTAAKTLVIVPSGKLHYLPFQALAAEQPGGTLRFLVQEKPSAVLPSLRLWTRIARRERDSSESRPGPLAAFGNPDATLPGAEQEVRRLGSLFEGSLVYSGSAVTLEHVKQLPPTIKTVHFATHGFLDDRDILKSHLVLANQERMTLEDVIRLKGSYPASMTVLSACDTALGRKDPTKSVAQMARAFLDAGSTTVVASLWQVSDAQTLALMERFYLGLREGKSIAEAKRAAELTLLAREETSHPYYWAPFILIGDWR